MTVISQELVFLCLISLSLTLFSLSLTAAVGDPGDPYVPTENLWINCGASGEGIGESDITWTGDDGSKFGSFSGNTYIGNPSSPSFQGWKIPFLSARIFPENFTYSFPVTRGRKFVRLFFYPSNYTTTGGGRYSSGDAIFGVTSGNFTLLRNFTAYLNLPENEDIVKFEFSLNVSTSDNLSLTFSPANPTSYAFINGISIVSMPDIFRRGKDPLLVRGKQNIAYPIDPYMAFQTVERLNIGGNAIYPNKDSGLYRSWSTEATDYILGINLRKDENVSIKYTPNYPAYIAPEEVYATSRSMGPSDFNVDFKLTWTFAVDGGFSYLIRLHFCEITNIVSKINMRVFDICINNITASDRMDVIGYTGGIGIPLYLDFVMIIPQGPRQKISVELHPNTESKPFYYDSILNGLEIFKIEDANHSLAGPNSQRNSKPNTSPPFSEPRKNIKNSTAVIGGAVGGTVAFLLVCIILLLVNRKNIIRSDLPSKSAFVTKLLPTNICRHFTLAEIQAATNDFDKELVIGKGGFGEVYRGTIKDEKNKSVTVAIKRGYSSSGQGYRAFKTEIEMLSRLRHRNLVSLIGYCDENGEMILVYDYMVNGTLQDHLYGTKKQSPLPWKQRLEICIEAARGLHHLHTGARHSIIHRDVKTANILLNERWKAKVSDFGISKFVNDTHFSSSIKGSHGYMDPEYLQLQELSEKSDVYSFGVVLFEVICARPALLMHGSNEQNILAVWAIHCKKKGTLKDIIDENLKKEIDLKCFNKYTELAETCVAKRGVDRPEMGDVVRGLELARQLQGYLDSFDEGGGGDDDTGRDPPGKEEKEDRVVESTSHLLTLTNVDSTTTSSTGFTSQVGLDTEFSEIMDPKER